MFAGPSGYPGIVDITDIWVKKNDIPHFQPAKLNLLHE